MVPDLIKLLPRKTYLKIKFMCLVIVTINIKYYGQNLMVDFGKGIGVRILYT